ncbi:MAG: hypothetical protein HXY34_08220 [Candidatus Thorarchaeota archaeon]|nr:hypothetical protein [Candidatus Thorarchaeota archaeon]
MNSAQRNAMQIVVVILVCSSILAYTFTLETHVYCDWTGLEIQERLGHEVTFMFHNGTRTHYCCVNVSLLAFYWLVSHETINQLDRITVHCPMCGMLMDWDDSMIVWVYSTHYLNPTTLAPTIVPLCRNVEGQELCEGHFMNRYGGVITECPYVWPN